MDYIKITTLAERGAGSLREAVEYDASVDKSNRIVVIPADLCGEIELQYFTGQLGEIQIRDDNIHIVALGDISVAHWGIKFIDAQHCSLTNFKIYKAAHLSQNRKPLLIQNSSVKLFNCALSAYTDNITVSQGSVTEFHHCMIADPFPLPGSPRKGLLIEDSDVTLYQCLLKGIDSKVLRITNHSGVPKQINVLNCVFVECARGVLLGGAEDHTITLHVVNCQFHKVYQLDPYATFPSPYIPINMHPIPASYTLNLYEDGNVVTGYTDFVNPNLTPTPDTVGDYGVDLVDASAIDMDSIGTTVKDSVQANAIVLAGIFQ